MEFNIFLVRGIDDLHKLKWVMIAADHGE